MACLGIYRFASRLTFWMTLPAVVVATILLHALVRTRDHSLRWRMQLIMAALHALPTMLKVGHIACIAPSIFLSEIWRSASPVCAHVITGSLLLLSHGDHDCI